MRPGGLPTEGAPLQDVFEDVTVPAQLLRATGNIGNRRDTRASCTWEPQPAFPDIHEGRLEAEPRSRRGTRISYVDPFSRRGTRISYVDPLTIVPDVSRRPTMERGLSIDRRASVLPDASRRPTMGRILSDDRRASEKQRPLPELILPEQNQSGLHRPLSYDQGSKELLDGARSKGMLYESHSLSTIRTGASSIWSRSDPFSSTATSTQALTHASQDPQVGPSDIEGDASHKPEGQLPRRGTLEAVVDAFVPNAIQRRFTDASFLRRTSIWHTYEKAKVRGVQLQRNKWVMLAFEYAIYAILLLFVYLVLIGVPLWNGAVYWLWWVVAHKFVLPGGFAITLGIALFYAFSPLLILFEKDPPPADYTTETKIQPNVQDTALLIPCYKSAGLIAATLEAALKIFPPSHIFVLANGNSPTPLDNTEEVCRPYGVNHIWSPIGSKIVAQYVGCYAAKAFKNVLLIDDDCALPDNFPVVTERLQGNVQCIGYTIKSVGPNSSKGNLCQQAQDLEYKLSGIQREFAGKIGSATFPHGAISLWDRELLVKTFHEHPGFSVSEDWFFGHVARQLGCRIKMCSQVFVETETPTAVFVSGGGSRGGFGEMTIFQQRFKRWNFFFVNGMYYDMAYILGSWKLGWWEIGAKIFVFQEVYETLLYLLTPFILPISFIVRPSFCGYLLLATIAMYLVNVIIFNEVHLRRKNERLGWKLVYVYYLPYKMILTGINVASCYWSLWKYARYFAKRHPKVIEDEKAVELILRLEENAASQEAGIGRRMTVATVGARTKSIIDHEHDGGEHVVPIHIDITECQLTVPEAAHLAADQPMNTPMRLEEGISAVDYFTVAAAHEHDSAAAAQWSSRDLEKQ